MIKRAVSLCVNKVMPPFPDFYGGKAYKKTAFRLEHRFAYKKLQLFFSERQRRTRIFRFEYLIKIRNRGETDIRTNGQY